MTSALIICNGEPPGERLVKYYVRECGLLIAADGGANICRKYGIRPDVIIGDLDSITASTRKAFATSRIIRVTRQDNTDLEKALDYLESTEIDRAVILGATGRRIDFTLGNISVLWKYIRRLHLSLVGDGWKAFPLGKRTRMHATPGTTMSLIPFGVCKGVTLRGLRYPLSNATMRIGDIGVSNVVKSSTMSVRVDRGNMLMILLDPRPKSA